ncbi:hypothetical protein R1flu_026114 [Riccia fluitans]|uniref:RING-type domain-containing protein n=1 Tax=Riccia fluitans TaxID=41844 RepID=A0ABD1XI13_9MARC
MLPGVEVARRRRVRQIRDLEAYEGGGVRGGGGLNRGDNHRSRMSVTVSGHHHHHHHYHHHVNSRHRTSASSSCPETPRPGSLVRRMQDVLQELHEHRLHSSLVPIGSSSERVHVIESTTSSHSHNHSHHNRNSTSAGGSSSSSGNVFGHHRSRGEFRDGHFASRWRRQASGALSDLRGAALEARNRLDERLRSTARASTNRYPETVRSQHNSTAAPFSRDLSIYSDDEDDSIWSDDEGWETSLQEWLAAWGPSVQGSWPHWPHWPLVEGPSSSASRWTASRNSRSAFKPKASEGLSEAAIKALPLEVVGQNGNTGKLEQEDCPVCLEGVLQGQRVITLPCQHRFHPECLTPWLSNHGQCPYCRAEIVKDKTPEGRNATSLQDDEDELSWVEVIERGMNRLNYS